MSKTYLPTHITEPGEKPEFLKSTLYVRSDRNGRMGMSNVLSGHIFWWNPPENSKGHDFTTEIVIVACTRAVSLQSLTGLNILMANT